MWPPRSIDVVAPPFAGHLFPLLDLARFLAGRGFAVRVLSTAGAAAAIRRCGLPAVELLPGRAAAVEAIANPRHRVGANPLRLYRQFAANLALMGRLRDQLRARWTDRPPDLALVDFAVPAAGLLARQMGVAWWTSMPSPCALETRTGTPAYLGGWRPRDDRLGRLRDALGRRLIRAFKGGVRAAFARELRALGVEAVYRADGTEAAYSPDRILALGMREFEFDRDWPPAVRFVGPLTAAPPYPHAPPTFPPHRPAVLVTLGTHLPWARRAAAAAVERLARALPDCVFHFARGRPGGTGADVRGNVHAYDFLPYDDYLPRYAAAVVHGGTGIVYSCIKAGVPMLVWPHDYDQFDHAARVVDRGLGLRLGRDPAAQLRRLLADDALRARVRAFQELAGRYDAHGAVLTALTEGE